MEKNKILVLSVILLTLIPAMHAQDLRGKPKWVEWMRKDMHYFKTQEHFHKYWERHFRPVDLEEEHEEKTEDPRRWIVKIFQSEEKARQKSNDLLIDYKYFKKWVYEVEPYVRSDGYIMTEEERIIAWQEAANHN